MARSGTAGLAVFVALLIALVFGWLWGSSGRYELEQAHLRAQARMQLFEAEAAVLQARLSLADRNFGEASGLLAAARTALQGAHMPLTALALDRAVEQAGLAGAAVEQAQALARATDPAAGTQAATAADRIRSALEQVPPEPLPAASP